jgi:hypothetical protein
MGGSDKIAKLILAAIALVGLAAGLSGCAGTNKTVVNDLETQIEQQEQQISQLESALKNREAEVKNLEQQVLTAQEAKERAYASMEKTSAEDKASGEYLLPPASPGECYARVFVPAKYEPKTEQVLAKQATERVEVVPAQYQWVEEKVLVREASQKLEEVPAQYEWVEEKVLVKEAHTVWKKGRGPIEKVDNATGEIMCLVEVPAEYKTVRKRMQVKPATTREVVIPAEYETIKVRKLVAPAQEKRVSIPAEYQTVTSWVKVSEGHMEWRQVLCETNLTRETISRIQQALLNAGHDPGPIDGIIGRRTRAAILSYQKEKGLAAGNLTYETLKSLGIKLG